MGIRKHKPTTPGRRGSSVSDFVELTRSTPEKSLLVAKPKTGGRNNKGHVTSRGIAGGHKQKYRIVDFKRRKWGVPATVERLEYDPNRTAFIALINYQDGEQAYILAPQRLAVGDKVVGMGGWQEYGVVDGNAAGWLSPRTLGVLGAVAAALAVLMRENGLPALLDEAMNAARKRAADAGVADRVSFEVASAHEEGGDRVYAVSTTEIIGDDEGKVSGLRLTEVERTDQGFEPVEGTERVLPAQLVLLAMGFLGPQQAGEPLDELFPHQLQRAEPVRLEQDQQPAVEGVQRLQRGGDLVRVVGEIIDDGDAACGPHHLHAAADAGEGFEGHDRLGRRDAQRLHGPYGGQGVGDVHPGCAAERRGQQVGPRQRHGPTPLAQHDHLAAVGRVEHDRPSAAAQPLLDELSRLAARRLEAEPHDGAAAASPHLAYERVVGVEHGVAVARHRLDDDGLDVGELLHGVDAAQAEVVANTRKAAGRMRNWVDSWRGPRGR